MIRDVVLDADGLPMVVATRSAEGQLAFRAVHMHPGGMMVAAAATPAMVAALAQIDEGKSFTDRRRAAQIAEARRLAIEIRQQETTASEMAAQLEAAGELAETERARADAAEAEIERLREQMTKDAPADVRPRSKGGSRAGSPQRATAA